MRDYLAMCIPEPGPTRSLLLHQVSIGLAERLPAPSEQLRVVYTRTGVTVTMLGTQGLRVRR